MIRSNMRIIVCIKQVPDTNEFKIDLETGIMIREGLPCVMNPDDKNALEEALRLKDEYNAEVIALTMGPLQAKDVLKEAMAMGADEVILINDLSFAGSDSLATAAILAAAIERIGHYDMILCGMQAMDGNTGQTGPQLAELLNIPQITYLKELNIIDNTVTATKWTESEKYTFKLNMPVLLTVNNELNDPRIPTMMGVMKAYDEAGEKKIKVWGANDLDIDIEQVGIKGSVTNIYESCLTHINRVSTIIEGEDEKEMAKSLAMKLSELNLI